MEAKISVLDRIGQSFTLYKNHFIDFFLPIFLYNIISFLVFGVAFMAFVFGNIGSIDLQNMDYFSFLNNPKIVSLIAIGMVIFIVYLLLYIPVLLGLIKSIKQAYDEQEVTPKANILYGFTNLTNSFKTYWYIFVYVAIVPAVFFIIGGILFNYGYYSDSDILKQIGRFGMIFGGILFIVFSIYRGLKSTFPIYSAVNNDSFTKEDFSNAINITHNNWWRILGNFILIGLTITIVSGLISGLLGIFSYSSLDFSSVTSLQDFTEIASNFSVVGESLSGFVNTIISTITSVFVIIFTYIFYMTLRQESIIVPKKGEIEL
ncbi:MAG: hypothetical protein PHS49_05740 [Candidatus Gracilibacteria bacterium]|nr:hypothetical protein [Candidatus Gracilibacteria bacterium]